MDSLKRTCKCAGYSFHKLFTKARGLAGLLVALCYLQITLEPLRALCAGYGEAVNLPGLAAYLMSDPTTSLVAGIGLLLLLGDAPFFDQAQQYVFLRGGKGSWVWGQILYMLVTVALYLAVLAGAAAALMAPYCAWNGQWCRVLYTLTSDVGMPAQYGIALDLPGAVMQLWSPWQALGLGLLLRWGALSGCAMLMFWLNLGLRVRPGVAAALAVMLLDLAVAVGLPYQLYALSPFSLGRLSLLNLGYNLYLPGLAVEMGVLWGFFALNLGLCLAVAKGADLGSQGYLTQ